MGCGNGGVAGSPLTPGSGSRGHSDRRSPQIDEKGNRTAPQGGECPPSGLCFPEENSTPSPPPPTARSPVIVATMRKLNI
ncbi:hypothetical protein NQZ68_039242 [Dissostichus eleginoides]|nr:hypothetical protein NQZ68_039242 [Dissostichus eleginoides]